MKSVDKNSFDQEVLGSRMPALVDFWSPQCQPCQALMPEVEELERKYGNQVSFFKVNAAENRRLAIEQQVMGLPAVVFYSDGKKLGQLSGNIDREQLEQEIKKLGG
ncbi:MAG: thioredoxin family protein [Firmicutes bacterium]|nr:thioredoxin family protein [Bacillota bacterium]